MFLEKKNEKKDVNLSLNYWEIFDIRLFGRGMNQVLTIIDDWIKSGAKNKWIATVNPEFVMKTTKDKKFKELLEKTDLNVVDGVGLLWAREVLNGKKFMKAGREILGGKNRNDLVSGADLIGELCRLAGEKKYKVFFLGGFGDRAERTANHFKSKFQISNSKIDWSPGEPDISNREVLKKINGFKPDLLFVAYGMKKQEEWIYYNKDKVDFGVAIGVGRSFDYYSGDLKRAPESWRKLGLEWFYSLIKEPKRIKRQLELPRFVWKVLKTK